MGHASSVPGTRGEMELLLDAPGVRGWGYLPPKIDNKEGGGPTLKKPFLAKVLCPLCVRAGGLRIFVEYISNTVPISSNGELRLSVCEVPVLSCSLPGCELVLVGRKEGNEAVFPDPHVQAVKPGA